MNKQKGFTPLEVLVKIFTTKNFYGILTGCENSKIIMQNKRLRNPIRNLRASNGASKRNRLLTGFTIIELIVVIAIITVLAAIVLINLVSYINKGRDASARADLSSALTSSALYYSDETKGNGTYNGFTDDPSYQSIYDALIGAGYDADDIASFCDVTDCGDPSTNWCMSVKLKAPSVANARFCVDTTGAKKETGLSICDSYGLCN